MIWGNARSQNRAQTSSDSSFVPHTQRGITSPRFLVALSHCIFGAEFLFVFVPVMHKMQSLSRFRTVLGSRVSQKSVGHVHIHIPVTHAWQAMVCWIWLDFSNWTLRVLNCFLQEQEEKDENQREQTLGGLRALFKQLLAKELLALHER